MATSFQIRLGPTGFSDPVVEQLDSASVVRKSTNTGPLHSDLQDTNPALYEVLLRAIAIDATVTDTTVSVTLSAT